VATDSLSELVKEAELMRAKLEMSRKALDLLAESGEKSETVLEELTAAVEKNEKAFTKASENVTKAQNKQGEAIGRASERATGLFSKTFGGGETAERLQSFSEALSLARGKTEGLDGASLGLGTRVKAGAAAFGIATASIASFGSNALQTIQQMRELSAQVSETDRRIEQLGSTLAEAQHSTQGTVNATELFATQQQLIGERIHPTTQELATLTRQLREYSIEMGGGVQQNTQQFLSALQSGDANALARFGVNLQGVSDHTERFRLAMEQFRTQQQGRALIPKTETEALQAESRELETLTGRASRLALQYSGIRHVVPLVEGAIERLNGLFGAQRDETEAATGASIRANVTLAQEATAMENAGTKAHGLAAATASVASETDKMSLSLRAGETEVDRLTRRLAVARDRIGAIRNAENENAQIRRQLQSEGFSAGEVSSAGLGAAPSAGGGGQAQQIASVRRELDAVSREARSQLIELPQVVRRINETRLEYLQRELSQQKEYLQGIYTFRREQFETDFRHQQEQRAAERASEDSLFEAITKRAEALRETRSQGLRTDNLSLFSISERIRLAQQEGEVERSLVGTESERTSLRERLMVLRNEENNLVGNETQGAQLRIQAIEMERESTLRLISTSEQLQVTRQQSQDVGFQLTEAFRRDADLTKTGAQSMGQTVMGAFKGMVGSIKAHTAAVIEGRETAGEAFRAIAHEALLGLATEAIGQGTFQIAAGIAALTNPVTAVAVAPQHFASAGMYFGVAALAGIGAAATTAPSTASANKSQQFTSASNAQTTSAPSTSQGGGPMTFIWNVGGNIFAGKESAEEATAQFVMGAAARGLLPTGT